MQQFDASKRHLVLRCKVWKWMMQSVSQSVYRQLLSTSPVQSVLVVASALWSSHFLGSKESRVREEV